MPMPAKKTPEKHCSYCGKLLERKRFNGRLEDLSAFRRRKYCDVMCMAQDMVQPEVSKSMHHKRAQAYRKEACESCGGTESLHVHHIDGNHENDAPVNLMTLCESCHLKWHWDNGRREKLSKPSKPCMICGKPAKSGGYCQTHYQRLRKYGDPLLTKRRVGSGFVLTRDDGELST